MSNRNIVCEFDGKVIVLVNAAVHQYSFTEDENGFKTEESAVIAFEPSEEVHSFHPDCPVIFIKFGQDIPEKNIETLRGNSWKLKESVPMRMHLEQPHWNSRKQKSFREKKIQIDSNNASQYTQRFRIYRTIASKTP